MLARVVAAERARCTRYGDVKPIIHADHQGHKLVAVGSRLFFQDQKRWGTFPDFLFDYVRHIFGDDWWRREAAKAADARHQVVRWHDYVYGIRRSLTPNERGICEADLDGTSAALMLMAYDLYVLRHHGKLQNEVVRRLRRPEHFAGARYELFVAATFIRASFDIAYEDESDASRKHPEFVATHRETGFVLDVEAKAKQRMAKAPDVRAGVSGLLRDAAGKKRGSPFLVFVEVNLPPEDPNQPPSWLSEIQRTIGGVEKRVRDRVFDTVIVTNLPHQYGLPGEPDPARSYLISIPMKPEARRVPDGLIARLEAAIRQYGNIPNEFPKE
jgi:hypothetical protein